MSPQDELFHEDWRDALGHVVKALGGFEAAGADLWPNKTRKAAGNWLSDCLNPERPAKLDLEEVEALIRKGRAIGCHTAMFILCDRVDYERPKPSAPRSRATEIAERKAALMQEFAVLSREQDRLQHAETLKSLKAAG